MVQTLNLILLTSSELFEFRSLLKQSLLTDDGRDRFISLYKSWCHNPVATFGLCLMAQCYELASALVFHFADIEVTVSFMMQIDKLVQLLESPIFIHLRLQLLEPQRHPFLLKSLYGLMMLLPQSSAFSYLKTRLESVAPLGMLACVPDRYQTLIPLPPFLPLLHFSPGVLSLMTVQRVRQVFQSGGANQGDAEAQLCRVAGRIPRHAAAPRRAQKRRSVCVFSASRLPASFS